MDPVTAVGVASAAVQFLQFSLQILNTCRQIRDSAQSSTEHNHELEKAVRTIRATRKDLEAHVNVPRRVSSIAKDCVQLSDRLTELLEQVRGANQNISLAKSVFRALRDQRKIEKLENSLKDKQDLLNQVLVQDTWIQSQLLVVEQSREFAKLDQRTQNLVRDLLSGSRQVADNVAKLDLTHKTELRNLSQDVSTHFETADRTAQARFVVAERGARTRHDQSRLAHQRERFLASLFFEDLHARRQNIKDPAPDTVEWIFRSPSASTTHDWDSFVTWLRDGPSDTYWIRGKAGSGKSTLMAHIVDDERTRTHLKAGCGNRELCVLSFYFWSPGSELQKSAVGLLRSLLYQICQTSPSLIDVVLSSLSTNADRLGTWTEKALTRSILAALSAASGMFFAIFIDALDEYSGDTHALVDFVSDLAHLAGVKCCISSRPEIQIVKKLKSCKQLLLERLNHDSIESFVASKLANVDLDSYAKEQIAQRIVYSAGGVFLWTALVVQDLILAVDSGDADPRILTERISIIPQELEDLFTSMLNKVHPLHRINLTLYISMVQTPFWSNTDLFLPISLITAVRMLESLEKQSFSDQKLAKLCAQTETQVIAQSAGLLVVHEVTINSQPMQTDCCFVKNGDTEPVSHNSAEDPCGRRASEDVYRRTRLKDHRPFNFRVYEDRSIDWVHRSAHDFIIRDGASGSLSSRLQLQEVPLSRIYDASLWLIAEAPSHAGPGMYCTDTAHRIHHLLHIIRASHHICGLHAERTLTKLKAVVERMDPYEFESEYVPVNRYGRAARKVLSLMILARMVVDILVTRDPGTMRICSGYMEARLVPFQCLLALSHVPDPTTNEHAHEMSKLKDLCSAAFTRLIAQYRERHADTDGSHNETRLVTFSTSSIKNSLYLGYRTFVPTTISFRCREGPPYHHDHHADILAQNEIATCAILLMEGRAGWDVGDSLAQQFFSMTNMYYGLGLESSRVSIQFPARSRSSPETWFPLDDVRVVCLPTRDFPEEWNEPSFVYVDSISYEIKSQGDYEILHTTIPLELTTETRAMCLHLIRQLISDPKTDRAHEIMHCRDVLIKDIWMNSQGLGSTEQLLALACIKTGFLGALYLDRVEDMIFALWMASESLVSPRIKQIIGWGFEYDPARQFIKA